MQNRLLKDIKAIAQSKYRLYLCTTKREVLTTSLTTLNSFDYEQQD